MINEKITLNSAKNNVDIVLKAIQGENDARAFEVTVTDINGVPVPLGGATANMYIEKRDGNIVMLPGTVSGNSATFILTLQASSVPGDNKVWVQIVEPDVMDLRADGAVLRVTPCDLDGAVESSSEFTALTELVASAASSAQSAAGSASAAAQSAAQAEESVQSLTVNGKQGPSITLTASDVGAPTEGEFSALDVQTQQHIGDGGIHVTTQEKSRWNTQLGINLLTNSNFLSPVNQRGFSSLSEEGYTIDRWYGEKGSGTLALQDGGMVLTGSDVSIKQVLESNAFFTTLAGEKVTVSMLLSGTVSVQLLSGFSTTSGSAAELTGDGVASHTFTLPESFGDTLGLLITGTSGTSTVKWVKLEIGDTATQYIPPDYGEELGKCERFYRDMWINGAAMASSSNAVMARIAVPTMRTKPDITVLYFASFCPEGWDKWSGGFDVTFKNTSDYRSVKIDATGGGGQQARYGGPMISHLTLDAEIYE